MEGWESRRKDTMSRARVRVREVLKRLDSVDSTWHDKE